MIKLKCTSGDVAGEVFELESQNVYVIGREPSNEEGVESIVLSSGSVSRRHCRISFQGDNALIKDLKSQNGIRVNKTKVTDAKLKDGDLLQIGAFSFLVEASKEQSQKSNESKTGKKPEVIAIAGQTLSPHLHKVREYYDKFLKLDLRIRMFVLFAVGGLVAHIGITMPILSNARSSLLQVSFTGAENAVRSLADRNKRELAAGTFHLLDCKTLVEKSSGIVGAYLYDSRGRIVCPVGGETIQDTLLEDALYRGNISNDCRERVINGSEEDCDFVFPIREWKDDQAIYASVGVARIRFSPNEASEAVQNLQSLRVKTLIFCLLILALLWWIWQVWTKREIELAVEGAHLAVTGAHASVQNLESFAALDPLFSEVNRLISKENQGLRQKSSESTEEASFLHSLLAQVLLLEERAVMVVDKDNQLIAASRTLPEVVPVEVSSMNVHITEAVADTHLQGELILLLNDLAQSSEVLDRALAMADRMIQARGMPLYLKDEFVASILIF